MAHSLETVYEKKLKSISSSLQCLNPRSNHILSWPLLLLNAWMEMWKYSTELCKF